MILGWSLAPQICSLGWSGLINPSLWPRNQEINFFLSHRILICLVRKNDTNRDYFPCPFPWKILLIFILFYLIIPTISPVVLILPCLHSYYVVMSAVPIYPDFSMAPAQVAHTPVFHMKISGFCIVSHDAQCTDSHHLLLAPRFHLNDNNKIKSASERDLERQEILIIYIL